MGNPAGASREESSFARSAAGHAGHGLVREFWDFLRDNKKWWLAPIIIVTLGLSLIVVLGGSAAAPFIYTLF
jgi:hypothetical protein